VVVAGRGLGFVCLWAKDAAPAAVRYM